jgi:hypothetical protein
MNMKEFLHQTTVSSIMVYIIIGYFVESERLLKGEILQSMAFLEEEVNGVLTT